MFKFLFNRSKKEAPKEAPKQEEEDLSVQTEVLVRRRLDPNMPVDITVPDTGVSFHGRIIEENNLRLIIGRLPGDMSLQVVPTGTEIELSAYNTDMEHVRVTATVIDSTVLRMVVRNWVLEEDRSKRLTKRYPLSVHGNLYDLDDTKMSHPKDCVVLDISETGAKISTNEVYGTGDQLRLQLEILKGDGLISMPSQVLWVKSSDGVNYECGLVFAELEKCKLRDLRESLRLLQQKITSGVRK